MKRIIIEVTGVGEEEKTAAVQEMVLSMLAENEVKGCRAYTEAELKVIRCGFLTMREAAHGK